MKRIAKMLGLGFVAVFLVGCETLPKPVHVLTLTTSVPVEINDNLLRDCRMVSPPDRQAFIQMTSDEREDALSRILLDQYQATSECTQDKVAIRKQLELQKAAIAAKNAKERERIEAKRKELSK